MAAVSTSYRRAGGLTLTLQILGVIDLLLSLGGVAIAGTALALQHQIGLRAMILASGGAAMLLMLQILFRLALLVVRAVWTHRLVCNTDLFQRLPVTPLWAWVGFFTPVISLWMPARMWLALAAAGPPVRRLNSLCVGWATLRWLTCPSGGVVAMLAIVFYVGLHDVMTHHRSDGSLLGLTLELVLGVAGTLGAGLGIVVTTWIARRQPRPDQLHHAEVF
jgi:hypothetical protein